MINRQNYTARIEQKKKNRLTAGLVSERFPQVESMVINMTYYQKVSNPVLMLRTVNVAPRDYAYFKMECMIKGCTNGGFDLTPVIAGLVKNKKKSGSGTMICKGKNEMLASGHASISYEITISYGKSQKKPAEKPAEPIKAEVKKAEAKKPDVKKPEVKKPEVAKAEIKKIEVKKKEVKKTDGKKPVVKKTNGKMPAKVAKSTKAARR